MVLFYIPYLRPQSRNFSCVKHFLAIKMHKNKIFFCKNLYNKLIYILLVSLLNVFFLQK